LNPLELRLIAAETTKDPGLIKAAFLCNFAKFTEWPATAFAGLEGSIILGTLGRSPLDSWLEKTARTIQVAGRTITVRKLEELPKPGEYHILYISAEAPKTALAEAMTKLGGSPLLTVGDGSEFAEQGGTIALLEKDGKMRFQVNLVTASAAGLKLNAGMLRLADRVYRSATEQKP